MRAATSSLLTLALLIGCGDTGSPTAPKTIRRCGELDGVAQVDPLVVDEDDFGCPIFAPVPCSLPLDEYRSACGPDCRPDTGTKANGDEWLLGCATTKGPVGCLDIEVPPIPPGCFVDPDVGDRYWYGSVQCELPIYSVFCWERCDGTGVDVPEACD